MYISMISKNILLLFIHCHIVCRAIVVFKTRGDAKIKNHNMAKEWVWTKNSKVLLYFLRNLLHWVHWKAFVNSHKQVANSQITEEVSSGLTFCFRLYLDVINRCRNKVKISYSCGRLFFQGFNDYICSKFSNIDASKLGWYDIIMM